ncbi:MAG: substrate-binding domain-containing protein [Blautia sp.]|nr:substrate-binding domain-containing protein [Blautia sp.]
MNRIRKINRPGRRLLWPLIFFIAFCFLLSGCGGAENQNTESSGKADVKRDDRISIGLSFDSFVIERWIRDRDVFVSKARKLGADVNVQNANGDVEEQISQIRYLIDKKVNVILVVAADCERLSGVMTEAQRKGIKTISYDRLVLGGGSDLYLSFDNKAVGTMMAEALKEAVPEGGDIFMIQGAAEDNNVALVREGFDEEIEGSNLNIVYEANCAGWLSELGADYVREALAEHPDVKGIMCGNDDIASSVIRVLSEERLAGQVAVVGQDGDLAACQRIAEGTQTMTAFKPVEDLAEKAAEYAVLLAKGDSLEDLDLSGTMSDGENDVDCLLLQPVSVKKNNMKQVIIDSGYHALEEVYLNVRE